MPDYEKMYFRLFNRVTDALAEPEKLNFGAAAEILKAAQQAGEDYYVEGGEIAGDAAIDDLKYTLALRHLHAKKVEFILQEIFAKLIMYNFCELITRSVVIQQGSKKHTYKVNFSDAVHICLQFFRGDIPPPDVEVLLLRFISPIRPGRKDARKLSRKSSVNFVYRVA